MDLEQARTFLAIAAHGSFLEAARRLHLTQSTVSARIQTLEADLGARLFVRNRAGASLTPSGRRFLRHAKTLVLTVEQARHDVGLPSRYRASIRIGGRIALWEGFLPRWVGWMRKSAPDVSIQSEIGLEESSTTRSQNPLLYTGNVGERLGEEEGDLFPPALLGQLPNLQHLAILAGGRIVKGRPPILWTPKATP